MRRAAGAGADRDRGWLPGRRDRRARARGRCRHRPARRQRLRRLRRHRGLQAASSATTRSSSSSRATSSSSSSPPTSATLLSLEGCLSGNAPGGAGLHRQAGARAVREARRDEAGAGRLRARDIPQPVRDPGRQAAQASRPRRPRRAGSAPRRWPRSSARRQGLSRAEQRAAGAAAAQEVHDRLPAADSHARHPLRPVRRAALDDPTFVNSVVFDSRTARRARSRASPISSRAPTSALISVRLRPDLSEAERREAIDLIRDGGRRPGLPDPRRRVRGQRRARRRRRPRREALERDLRPARRGAGGHGADAGAGLQAAAAAAAARVALGAAAIVVRPARRCSAAR